MADRRKTKPAHELAVGDRIARSYFPFQDAARKTKLYVVDQVHRIKADKGERIHVMSGAMSLTFRPDETVTVLIEETEDEMWDRQW